MWFLIYCTFAGCLPAQAMPSRDACKIVGMEMWNTAFDGAARKVVCINGDTGEAFKVKEPNYMPREAG